MKMASRQVVGSGVQARDIGLMGRFERHHHIVLMGFKAIGMEEHTQELPLEFNDIRVTENFIVSSFKAR